MDRLAPALRRALAAAFQRLAGRVPLEDLARAVQTGRVTARLAAALDRLADDVRAEVAGVVAQAVQAGARNALEVASRLAVRGRVEVPPSAFRQVNARAVERATSAATARLVRAATRGTKQAIREAVTRAVSGEAGAASRGAASRAIRASLGLDPRRARAVTNYRLELERQGVGPARAGAAAERYAQRLLRQRAATVARTEIMGSANEGRLAQWRQLQNQGFLPDDAERVWVVAPDDRLCDQCAPMDGQRVALDEPFDGPDGPIDAPPLHPNCRCTAVLAKRGRS